MTQLPSRFHLAFSGPFPLAEVTGIFIMEMAINCDLECSDRLRFRTIVENESIATGAGPSRNYHK